MKSRGILASRTTPSFATKRLISIVVVAGLVLLLYGQMTKSNSASDSRRTVIFMGSGGLDDSTASQPMSGSYLVKWQSRGSCSYLADLNGISVFSAESATSGTRNLRLKADTYHIHMITSQASDCGWQVKFSPS